MWNHIEDHPFAAVLLDMGLGKTSITLTAIADLLFDSFEVHKVLVIAPLRVARDTWSAELQKWDQLHHLTYSVAVGSEAERKAALTKKADIYIINRENVQWLIEKSKLPFDYDMIVVDELSSFKNHQSKRFKALMQVRPRIKRVVGLTGTPASNGLMDLWAEFKVIDIAFDRWGAVQMVQNLESMGFTVVPFGQGFKDMSPPTKELMKLVLEQRIAHGGHPVLHWMMDNIFIRTDPAGNIKPDKEKSTEKIDGAVATVMALDRAIRCGNDTTESVYDTRGLLFL